MSLEGSIKEFGLAEILQLISMQKKSGVVSISHKGESTTLHFDNGQLVFATSISGGETKRLGEILVNSGKITENNLREALRKQATTKERIGNIFVSSGCVSTEDVKEALQQQLMDVIFHVLRWKDGYYKFKACEIVYDREFQIPVQTDFILMEGSRMVDEWSFIESKIPSDYIVFSQTEKGGHEAEQLFSRLNTDEVTIYNLIDGKHDIRELMNISQLGKFDLYRILLTLMMSGLITQTSLSRKDTIYKSDEISEEDRIGESTDGIANRGRLQYAFQMAFFVFIISFLLLLFPAGEMAGLHEASEVSEILRQQKTKTKLRAIKRAIGYYFLDNGKLPDSLTVLLSQKYIGAGSTYDEWDHPFIYEKYPADKQSFGYRLYSNGKDRTAWTQDDIF